MNRFILLTFAVHSVCASATIADDYLLRLDTIGYVEKPASEKAPKETVLRSIEVVAHPNSTFHGRVTIGPQTLTLAGTLYPADDGGFKVHIRYIHSLDTGTTVPGEDGRRQPLPETTTVDTDITIIEDGSVAIGGIDTTTEESGKRKHKSRTRHVMTLAKYELADS
ncbi:MAG: hypothetical protein ACQESR_01010 [Planctomycetota bacterium]